MAKKIDKDKSFIFNTKNLNDILERIDLNQKVKQYEKPWFKNIAGLRKPGVKWQFTGDEEYEYFKCKSDIFYFAEKYCKIKSEDGKIKPIKLRDYQYDVIDLYTNNRFSILMASRQTGKDQPLTSLLWTDNGPIKMCDIKIGDKIYDETGNLTTVEEIYPQGLKSVWEITFSDGNKVKCGYEHLWGVENKAGEYSVKTLKDIIESNHLTENGDYKWFVKITKPVNYSKKELTIDPYIVGKNIRKYNNIDKNYLYSDINDRLELLRGILDWNSKESTKYIYFDSKIEELTNNIQELAESLGLIVIRDFKNYKNLYRLKFKIPTDYEYTIFKNESRKNIAINKVWEFGNRRAIAKIEYVGTEETQCITVDNASSLYLTNHYIPTHNTITAAITMLHYITFNNDKGVMIVANKATTVIEIIDKIKNIYKQLPYFLKVGITNWSNRTLAFDTGCRIKSEARTKEPAIGFTIDFLYLDEFAHIPANIIGPYYRAVVPTVSSVQNSKIVITSTPNGPNLFFKLWQGANLLKGDPNKNPYKALKVMWHQVPGRRDNRIYFNEYDIQKYKFDIKNFETYLYNNNINWRIEEEVTDDGEVKQYYALEYSEQFNLDVAKQLTIDNININKVAKVTNWEEQETLLIGSKEAFDQEYNLHFLVGSKRIFEPEVMKQLYESKCEYENLFVKELADKFNMEYDELLFIKDKIEFDLNKAKSYYGIHTIDLAEGVGGDHSVLNLFKCKLKSIEEIKQLPTIKGIHDLFKLKQIGRYSYNKISVQEFALLYYIIAFEVLDPYKWKTILEANMFGGEFINAIPPLFNRHNKFGTYIMCRFKHRADAEEKKIGIKVGHNKNLLIKNFQDAVKKSNLELTDPDTHDQLNTFVKHEKAGGGISYKAEVGHDDLVMSSIHAAQFLETQDWKIMCEKAFSELDKLTQDKMSILMKMSGVETQSSSSILRNARNIIKNNNRTYNNGTN